MKKLSYSRIIAIGFFVMIMLGTVLLMLPVSAQNGEWTSFKDALFTAVSAQCVTGLTVVDTAIHWSFFGQIVIILLIQTGGLGFISIGVFFTVMLKKKLSLSQRALFQESMNTLEISGVAKLTKKIMAGVFAIEAIAAVILTICFLKNGIEPLKAVYYGIFHAISAFCNAGFSTVEGNLVPYRHDIVLNVVVMTLITVGGLGFVVWDDIWKNKWHFKKYMLQTKIVLLTTTVITLLGALLLFITEQNTVLPGMSLPEKITASFFGVVTARTAGFNTVDLGLMSPAGKFVTMLVMFIGGSPGSTAGGIKTTTFIVIIMFMISNYKGGQTHIFGKRLEDDSIRKATTVCATNLTLITVATLVITVMTGLDVTDVLYESISAISTVGMTTGITTKLGTTGQYIMALMMYLGRVGSMSFAVSFFEKKKKVTIGYVTEKISIG